MDLFEYDVEHIIIPNWNVLSIGSYVTVVVKTLCWLKDIGLMNVSPLDQTIRAIGTILIEPRFAPNITLVNAVVSAISPVVMILIYLETRILPHHVFAFDKVFDMVEICCNSFGFAQNCFTHRVSVELQPAFVELHKLVYDQVPVIQGDISEIEILLKLWHTTGAFGLLMAGIACQPYSSGGQQRGGSDARALTLPGVLQLLHRLAVPILVVECVVPARDNQFVRNHLQKLNTDLGYHITDCVLRLEDTWVSNRFRWWMVASHPAIGPIMLPPMPQCNHLGVRDVIPGFPTWPPHEQDQLLLTEREYTLFEKYGPFRKFAIQVKHKLPTALHSWGNQVEPCQCGCRNEGFSENLLKVRGIYAQVVPLKSLKHGKVQYRHLHPKELAILYGVPPKLQWHENLRLCMAAIGQLASPLQATWVSAHIVRHLQALIGCDTLMEPLKQVHEFKRMLLRQASEVFHEPRLQPEGLRVSVFDECHGFTTQIALHRPVTVAQFLQVETQFAGLDFSNCQVLLMPAQSPVTADFVLENCTILIRRIIPDPLPDVPFTDEDLDSPMPD